MTLTHALTTIITWRHTFTHPPYCPIKHTHTSSLHTDTHCHDTDTHTHPSFLHYETHMHSLWERQTHAIMTHAHHYYTMRQYHYIIRRECTHTSSSDTYPLALAGAFTTLDRTSVGGTFWTEILLSWLWMNSCLTWGFLPFAVVILVNQKQLF
ncbi:hypothetical protein KIL84_010136 [Mauremys mutica]|uniref:Uncharacterized protein n=1 Tax=Mauremys mutica TaxID=74926 RepID=A0A9D4AZI6_9SAUR|nr:hypothetical protein KIL84_010136 [Mauremys mutica]